ncbi:MAG TPA: carbohydrate kinase family protein [Anaerolineae bacterium]|nr:carbohydrate kinase family protein [Anaerolineae bacterium]
MSFPGRFKDHILPDQLANISLSFLVDSMSRQRGGTAPNIAYTIALLGGKPTVMATAGQDFSDYRAFLEQKGVDTSGIVTIEDDFCASFFVNSDLDQNQIASFYTGAMAHAATLNFATHAPGADLVIISPNDPVAMRQYVTECQEFNIAYIYDPSQQIVRLDGETLVHGLTGSAWLTVNEYEFSLVQEKTGLSEADILERTGGLIITKGEKGSLIIKENMRYNIPVAKPKAVVEPTGAGDAFRAGFMRGLQLDLPLEICGRLGALSAVYVVEQQGPQEHKFTPAEFIARYEENFGSEPALAVLTA